jgi:ABC-type multidrug transport system ATPase subunit/peptidoglycan/LPS O-acetylase OafA/YrhL
MTRPADPTERLHALDAARAFALLLGIGLHATMSFFLPVPASDSSQSATLAVGFYVVHLFRMALFFLLAGFFARLSLQRRGTREFIKERAHRILVPMSVGWLVLAPLTLAVTAWGWSRGAGVATAAAALAPPPQGLPLIHLWFLYYLALVYVLALSLRALAQRIDAAGGLRQRIDAGFRSAIAWRLAPAAIAAPICVVLFLDAKWAPWFGVPTPDTGLMPQLPALLAFGASFAVGWLLHRQAALLQQLASQWRGNLALAVALTIACVSIVGPVPKLADATAFDGGVMLRFAYAAAYTLAAGYWSLGLLGAALRFFAQASAVRRYLADASYWLYLVHLPVVFALQVLVAKLPWHWSVKFPLVVVLALALLLTSYHWLVRPTVLGEVLNGRKIRRGTRAQSHPIAQTDDGCVARLQGVRKRYGATLALDGLDLEVRAGELLAVLGPNGAGKSTAIGLWLGTLEADEGSVTVLGGPPSDVRSRLGLGVMLQDVALAPELRAREHVALVASYYREPCSVDEAIALAGIAALADARYGKLSGGQKRQVQFALAVCGRPRLLFLDEPTVGLDVEARQSIWRAIRVLRDAGCAIVLTTHYLEEAEALADRVVVVAKGRAIAEGTVAQMRALVARRRIRCASALSSEVVARWPGVHEAKREDHLLSITASDAEDVVRRLFAADPTLTGLEVQTAGLAEAFSELTKEAA